VHRVEWELRGERRGWRINAAASNETVVRPIGSSRFLQQNRPKADIWPDASSYTTALCPCANGLRPNHCCIDLAIELSPVTLMRPASTSLLSWATPHRSHGTQRTADIEVDVVAAIREAEVDFLALDHQPP
jgi:hypothetical protein